MKPCPAPFLRLPRRLDCVRSRREDKEIRAMDSRRFVPSTEGLEGRALLTSLFGSASSNPNPSEDIPMTFVLKEARIEKLPHYMQQFRSGRFLPPDTIA